jgi:molybdate transport system ATP-binding protein
MRLEVAAAKDLGGFKLDARFAMPTPGVAALFGRSGCGKTTLVNLIAGLITPDRGRIALGAQLLFEGSTHTDVPAERRGIGYVFQDSRLFPHLSVAANLRYGARRARGRAYVTEEAVVALLALEPLLGRRTHQLSGGERQRVAIGRALLAQPRLLLLDEPLAALDAARREEVLPYLELLRDQLAIPMVYVTHDFGEVLRLATHVVLMDAGRVIAEGDLQSMSLDARLRSIIGPEQVGAILDGMVVGADAQSGLTRVRVGAGELKVQARHLAVGTALRVQMLARDIIVSTEAPRALSVRNQLLGCVAQIQADDADSDLVTIDIGAARILARITRSATTDLGLHIGRTVWALVKAVSLRGRSFAAPVGGAAAGAEPADPGPAGAAPPGVTSRAYPGA